MLNLFKFMGNGLGKTEFITANCYENGEMTDISDSIKEIADGRYVIPNIDGSGFSITVDCSNTKHAFISLDGSDRCDKVEYYCYEKDWMGNVVNGAQHLVEESVNLINKIEFNHFFKQSAESENLILEDTVIPMLRGNNLHSGDTNFEYNFGDDDDGFFHSPSNPLADHIEYEFQDDDDGFFHPTINPSFKALDFNFWEIFTNLDLVKLIQDTYNEPEQHPYAAATIIASSAIAVGVTGYLLYRQFMKSKTENSEEKDIFYDYIDDEIEEFSDCEDEIKNYEM